MRKVFDPNEYESPYTIYAARKFLRDRLNDELERTRVWAQPRKVKVNFKGVKKP